MTAGRSRGCCRTGAEVDGRVTFDGTDVLALSGVAAPQRTGSKVAVVFQDPRAHINPVRRIDDFMTESLRTARRRAARPRRAARAAEAPGGGRDRRPGQAPAAVPARAVRRHAPAGHDRHRAALRAPAAARRRVHHRARRHHPVRGDGDPRRPATRARAVDAVHHPRPRARRCRVRPHLRDVRRPGRRDPAADQLHGDPLHPYSAALVQARPDITSSAAPAGGDPGPARLGVRGAVRLPLRPALPARRRTPAARTSR